jgi:MFS family permease
MAESPTVTSANLEEGVGTPEDGFAAPGVSRARAIRVLIVTTLVCLVNYYDRNLMGILVQPIKTELHLSDTQIGMMTGFAFALVYSIVAVPVGRIADSHGRTRVLAVGLTLWSGMTMCCGRASGFLTFLLARLGVGVGEATGLPTCHAIVAEHFSLAWRARALSVLAAAAGLGITLANALGGYVADQAGWRAAFYSAGGFGLILSVLLILIVRDVPRKTNAEMSQSEARESVWTAIGLLLRRRSFFALCFGLGIASIGVFSLQAWIPAYLLREFGGSPGPVGFAYAVATGPSSIVGLLGGGLLADRLSGRDARWPMRLLALNFVCTLPLIALFLMARSFHGALFMAVPMALLNLAYTSPAYTLVQNLTGDRYRAIGAAIFLLAVNLIGLGIGPALTGRLSDALTPSYHAHALGVALACISTTYLLGAAIFLWGTRTLVRDLILAQD